MRIPHYLHRALIGSSGIGIKKIIAHFGGPDKIKIQFPHSHDESDSDSVFIQANRSSIESMIKVMEGIVAAVYLGHGVDALDLNNLSADMTEFVDEEFYIPRSEVSRLLDRGGKVLLELESKYSVKVWIEDHRGSPTEKPKSSTVRIVSRPDNAEATKATKDEIMVIQYPFSNILVKSTA